MIADFDTTLFAIGIMLIGMKLGLIQIPPRNTEETTAYIAGELSLPGLINSINFVLAVLFVAFR